MKRRVALSLPLLAWVSLRTALVAAADASTGGSAAESSPFERFRFHSGAPLLAPAAVGLDGSVCVGTADGYVHLLGSDGEFRWSHSVRGAVTQPPVFAGRLWLVATSAERIYALTGDGTLSWVFRPPSPISSELTADATDTVFFVGADHFLYGVSTHGGVSLRAPFGQPKQGPRAAPDGAVWAQNQAGNLVRVRGQELRRVAPSSPPEFDFGTAGTLRDPDGREWLARSDGVLDIRRSAGSPTISLALTTSALFQPSWSSFAHYVLVSARDGLVVALAA